MADPFRPQNCTCHPDPKMLLEAELSETPVPACTLHGLDDREQRARVEVLEEAVAEMRASNERASRERRPNVGLADILRFGMEHPDALPLNATADELTGPGGPLSWAEPWTPLDAA